MGRKRRDITRRQAEGLYMLGWESIDADGERSWSHNDYGRIDVTSAEALRVAPKLARRALSRLPVRTA